MGKFEGGGRAVHPCVSCLNSPDPNFDVLLVEDGKVGLAKGLDLLSAGGLSCADGGLHEPLHRRFVHRDRAAGLEGEGVGVQRSR